MVFKTSSSATASQEAPAAEKSAVATQEQASQEEKGQGIPKPVAPAQQESAQRAEQAAERPSALEVQQLEGGSLMVRARKHLMCPLMQPGLSHGQWQ